MPALFDGPYASGMRTKSSPGRKAVLVLAVSLLAFAVFFAACGRDVGRFIYFASSKAGPGLNGEGMPAWLR